MTAAMDQLATLVALKRKADTIDGLQTYIRELYVTAAEWTDGGTPIGTAALCFDSLVDRVAHEEPTRGTERPVERSHTGENAMDAKVDPYGPQRLTAEHTA